MAIDKKLIEETRRQSLGGDPNTGGLAELRAVTRADDGSDPAGQARLGKGTAGFNLRPDKFDFQMRAYGQNEELRANQFGALKSFGAGLANLVTNTAFETASGLASVVAGIPSAIANGDVNMMFDNAISTAVDDAQNWMNEEIFPIYNSVKDSDKNILHRALTDLEFWTDDIMSDGVPFMASAWLTAYGGVGLLRPLTKARYLNRLKAAEGLGAEATAAVAKNLQATEQLGASVVARTVEGLVEAKDTRDMTYEKLIAKGLTPEEASSEAGKAAMATFGLNYLLTPIEYIQAGSWFKTFGKSRDQLLKATKKGFELPKRYTLNKVAKEAGVNVITEGPIEENFQKAVQDYVYERFTGNERGQILPWEDEFRKGAEGLFSKMGENFTTKEGWDAIGTGSILGGLFGGAAGYMSSNAKAEKQRLEGLKDNLAAFSANKQQVDDRVNAIIESVKGYHELDKLSQVQQLRNKEHFWNIFETLKFAEYAYANFEAGLGEKLSEQIDEIEQLSQEEFLSGYKDKTKVEELKGKATRYEELFNMINERFQLSDSNEDRRVKKALFREAILQEELEKEIGKLEPKLNELKERLQPGSEYERIVQDKNSLIRENRGLTQTVKDVEGSTDEEWKKKFGSKLASKLNKEVNHNKKLIKQLDQAKLAFVESQGENFVKPRTIQSKVLKDEFKTIENNINQLKTAHKASLGRYDILASPKIQKAAASIIENSIKANEENRNTITKAKEEAAKQATVQQVANETGKAPEKVVSNVAQLHDTVTATHKTDGQIKGIVFEVNDDSTIRTVQANSIIYPIKDLSNVVVVKKRAEESKTEDNDVPSWLDDLAGGGGIEVDPSKINTGPLVDPIEEANRKYEEEERAKKEANKTKPTGKTDPQDTEPEETELDNPDVDMSEETYLFEEQKKRTNPYALGGLDVKYNGFGNVFIEDQYDSQGRLVRGDQVDFYNYVNDPDNDLTGVTGKLTLVDTTGDPDSIHIRFTLPNGLSTSLNTVDWVRSNVAKITDEDVRNYAKWRGQVVAMLQTGKDVNLALTTQGPGALLRNQKVNNKRARRKLSELLDPNSTPIGVTIKSKKGEQHTLFLYDWKGARTPATNEFYGFGKSGRVYVGLPAANKATTPVPVWARTLDESEAKIVIRAIRARLEGRNYETIPGSTWTYNDLIRFYVYPSSSVKSFDMFISEQDKSVRVGKSINAPRYFADQLNSYPQDLVAAIMNKLHQVQNKRIINNEEIPRFTLVNDQLVVDSTIRYREYIFNNVLETDIQPIKLENKDLYFGQPVMNYDPQSVFAKAPVEAPKVETKEEDDAAKAAKKILEDEDDIFNLPAPKRLIDTNGFETDFGEYNEKELLEVMKLLPQVPIRVVKDLIKVAQDGGFYAVGTFHKGLITLYENAPIGTVYHEAFHAVFRMMLSANERKQVTEKYTEEQLAELFEDYMLSDGKILPSDIGSTAKGFFARLWDAIKTFVLQLFGKVTPDDIFKRIKTGYYKNFDGDPNLFKSIAPKPYNLSPMEEVWVMNYVTRMFFNGIFRVEDFDLNSIESIGVQNKHIVDIYNNIRESIRKRAEEAAPGDLKSKYEHIVDKFDELVKTHQNWMAKYKIVPPDIDYDPTLENLKLKDSFQYAEPTEFSAKDNAGYMVKLFIAALPKMETREKVATNPLGLPEVTDYSETWNFLLDKLEGSDQLTEMAERLVPYFKIKPELEIIHRILTKPGTLTQELFKTQFRQSFSKTNVRPVTTLFEKGQGEAAEKLFVRTITSEQQSHKDTIRKTWESNFINSDLAKIDPLSQTDEYLSDNALIEAIAKSASTEIEKSKNDINVILQSLERLAITFTPKAVESWIEQNENGKTKFVTAAKYIINRLGNPELADKFQIYLTSGFEESGNMNFLAEIEMKYNPTILEAVHLNPEKKPTNHYIQNSFLSTMINDVRRGDTGYMDKVLNSLSGASSKWAAAMKAGVKPVIKLLEGARMEGFGGKLTTKLGKGMWTAVRVNNILQEKPIFSVLRPAEKKSEYGVEGFELVKSGVVRNNNGKGLTAVDINSNILVEQFYGYFEDEYKRTIYTYLKDRKRQNADIPVSLLQYVGLNSEADINTDSIEPFDTRAKKLTFFGPIISQSNRTLLQQMENFHRPEEGEIQDIKAAIKQYLVSQINRTFDYLNDNAIIQVVDDQNNNYASRTAKYKNIRLNGSELHLKNVAIGQKQLELYAGDVFAAVADFAVNEMVSTFEMLKLTMGDAAYYKDFFKRTPLVTGTGKTTRIDQQIANYIDPEYGKLRKKYALTKSKEEVAAGDLNLAVVRSPKKKSSQLKQMKEQLKALGLKDTQVNELVKGYEGYDESDAFSWITPQAAREFLIRIGDWNPSLESIYDDIIHEREISYKRLKNFMTVMKLMGSGPINTGDNKLLPIAYLKTATMPIIPRAVKGKTLGQLLERMYQSGTDMVIVDSGSKAASYEIQELYNEKGQMEGPNLKNAKFNFKHVKLQIDVQQQSKSKTVFGTQLRKHIFSNVFQYDDNGKLIEKEFKMVGRSKPLSTSQLWKEFNKTYDDVLKKYKTKILTQLGINYDFVNDTYTIVDWAKLVQKLKDEAITRSYANSVVESIQLNAEGNGLEIPGDALVNRRSIENMMNALIYNNVVAQKFFGTSSVQVPVTGFEDIAETKTETRTDSSGALKFISYDTKEGKVLEAEILVPHNFRAKSGYLSGLTIDQVDPEVLQLIGFRIPTEGPRSIIKLKIKGFLPREMGDVVVVPSELVAQAGSDFDIDTLKLLQRHYYYDEEAKKIKKVSSDEDSIEGLENRIFDMTDALLSHKDMFVSSLRTTGQTVDYLKGLAEEIKQSKGEPIGLEEDPLSIIEFDKKMDIAFKFITGKNGVGVAALHNTHHVLTQAANIRLTKEATELLNFPYNKNKDNKALLSGSKDVNKGFDILDITAAAVNGFVDIVKNPFIIDLFTDINTASLGLMQVRLGSPVEWTANFINQPIIQRYIKNTDFARSEMGRLIDVSPYQVVSELRQVYFDKLDRAGKELIDTSTWQLKSPLFKNVPLSRLKQYMHIGFENGEVVDDLASISNNPYDITSNEYYLAQLSFLNDFIRYKDIGGSMSLFIANTASDTFHAKSFNDVDRFIRRKLQESVNERVENVFENYTDVFGTEEEPTFIQSFFNHGLSTEHKAFGKIFPIRQSDQVQAAVRSIEAFVGRTNSLRNMDIEKISDSLMGYIFYGSFTKEEMKSFLIDTYNRPGQDLLISSRMRYNLRRGKTNKFIKKGKYFNVGDRLNLSDTHSVEITHVAKTTNKQLVEKFPNEAPMLGARYFREGYLYQVKIITNELSSKSEIRKIHDYKISKDTSNPIVKELQDNVFFKNLRVNFSRKIGGVNSLRFRARPSDNVVAEDLVGAWRKMFESPQPTVRDLAWKIAKYAIYQSGMKQSNMSFFRYIPPEIFAQIVNNSLINIDPNFNLNDPAVLSVIFKNLWKNDVLVPPIRSQYQLVEIFSESGDIIGYRLRRGYGSNARFFVNNAPPPYLKFTFDNLTHLMELVGFAAERRGGDAIYQITSKLGDGVQLSEYHPGPSIYEANNEYIEDIRSLHKYISSSPVNWTATEALALPVSAEDTVTSESDVEGDTGDINEMGHPEPTPSMGDTDVPSWLDDLASGGGKEVDPFKDQPGGGVDPLADPNTMAQLSSTGQSPNKELDNLLRAKLAEIGVTVEDVDRIYSKHSPVAVAKILEGVIKIAKGQASITTLPEEAAHIFVGMLDKSNPLMQKMLREIVDYKIYKDTVAEYGKVYDYNEDRLRLEAVGKLIGNIIVNNFTGETSQNVERAKGWWNRVWEIIKKILNKVTLGALEQYTTNNATSFEQFATDIVNKRPNRTLSETIINNNFETIVSQMLKNKYITKLCP
jgi:hypothetical protein